MPLSVVNAFVAFGRDVTIPEGEVLYDEAGLVDIAKRQTVCVTCCVG